MTFPNSAHTNPAKPEIDISHKLSHEDIDKIEKYRQTRKTSVLSILFTDIVGYTDLTYRWGEVASARLRHIHDEIIIGLVKKDGFGEIIKEIGDSFMIVFSDPVLAVRFGLTLQELFRINSENLTHDNYTLKIRVGLHMGQVSVENHIIPDVFGIHINLASRVMSLAKGGQLLVTGAVWENASGWLKDEEKAGIRSVYYGKIKLKGIGKATEIYEFYTETSGKAGIPGPLSRKKQRTRMLRALLVLLLAGAITIPLLLVFKYRSATISEKAGIEKRKLILANIVSNTADRDSTVVNLPVFPELKSINERRSMFSPIGSNEVEKLNESYQVLLKTNFIADFEIQTEEEIKQEYAKKGLRLPGNLCRDNNIWKENLSWPEMIIISPHLYACSGKDKYIICAEIQTKDENSATNRISYDLFSDLDSVPYFFNKYVKDVFHELQSSSIGHGCVIQLNRDEVIIKLGKLTKKPIAGLMLKTSRYYNGSYQVITDSAVLKRLTDLKSGMSYYGSAKEWVKKQDTNDYYWSYAEYKDLMKGDLHGTASGGFSIGLGIELKIMQVFDSTALAKILNHKYPWVELKAGDYVELK